MKVKLRGDISGTRNGEPWPARGETIDVPDEEGAGLCAAGLAEPVAEPARKRGSTATRKAPQKRTAKKSEGD